MPSQGPPRIVGEKASEAVEGLNGGRGGEWCSDRLAMSVLGRRKRHRVVGGWQSTVFALLGFISLVSFTSWGLSFLL